MAGMFHETGCKVTGSDQGVYPPMSDFLAGLGIQVARDYSPSNLVPRPDLVVVGNVIRRANPEAVALERSGIPYTSMPVALVRYFTRGKTRIVVTGTHGKTTVSAMIAWVLAKEHCDPGFMIGGLPTNFRTNYRLGQGDLFVIEGDEYDTAYFDKRPKFLHYGPHVGIITSCEFDHGDIYESLEQIQERFRDFTQLIPPEGRIIAYTQDSAVRQIITSPNGRVGAYGSDPDMEWSTADVHASKQGTHTEVLKRGRRVASGTLPVFGYHNMLNALAAVAACDTVGVKPQRAMEALASFRGVRRRQEILGEIGNILVMDDFAHHPTAVRATCEGMRERFPSRRLVAVFEPRTNTSRRSFFQKSYVPAFLEADLIAVREPRDPEKFPEGDRFSSERLARDLRSHGKDAHAFADTDAVLEFLSKRLHDEDVVLLMSNGNFDNIGPRLLDILRERIR